MKKITTQWCLPYWGGPKMTVYKDNQGRFMFCNTGLKEYILPKDKYIHVRLVMCDEYVKGASLGVPASSHASASILRLLRRHQFSIYEAVFWYPEIEIEE